MNRGLIIFFLGLFFFLGMTNLSVFAGYPSSPFATDIEVVPDDGKLNTPTATPVPTFTPSGESYNENPFENPLNGDEKKGAEKPISTSSQSLSDEDSHNEQPFINPLDSGSVKATQNEDDGNKPDNSAPVGPVNEQEDGIPDNLFVYKGVLWNGVQSLGIVVSGGNSYIVRAGDKLIEGYRVLCMDEKELVVVKDGKKVSLKLE